MYSMGPFDIIAPKANTLNNNSNFGQFNYCSLVVVVDPDSAREVNLEIDLSGNGSKDNSLAKDNVYILAGRFVQNPVSSETDPETGEKFEVQGYTFFFEQAMTLLIGTTVNREQVSVRGTKDSVQNNLHVTMKHTDYHSLSKGMMEFNTVYIIPGLKHLVSTFHLFQAGREALIVGYLNGFDEENDTWQVMALLVSMSSGGQTRTINLMSTPASAGSEEPLQPNL
ncbi:hypothetical protein PtA15_10A315 [Puccinia triticina]|uniref:Uncharacterized protein n=1 Tax=Puccinia triticina TaxID=208348 RepID=A0ABY7CUF7_9BASI|nr:uncharacterized protein PtA15_10A315 [Puccinia triticina]WAQ88894.1 hypothetical protein PtA15_10A315 [Puccinia triticina]